MEDYQLLAERATNTSRSSWLALTSTRQKPTMPSASPADNSTRPRVGPETSGRLLDQIYAENDDNRTSTPSFITSVGFPTGCRKRWRARIAVGHTDEPFDPHRYLSRAATTPFSRMANEATNQSHYSDSAACRDAISLRASSLGHRICTPLQMAVRISHACSNVVDCSLLRPARPHAEPLPLLARARPQRFVASNPALRFFKLNELGITSFANRFRLRHVLVRKIATLRHNHQVAIRNIAVKV